MSEAPKPGVEGSEANLLGSSDAGSLWSDVHDISRTMSGILVQLMAINVNLALVVASLSVVSRLPEPATRIAEDTRRIADSLCGPVITGIEIVPGVPYSRPPVH